MAEFRAGRRYPRRVVGERTRLKFAQSMRVFEASLRYNLIQLGDDVTVDTPAKVIDYLKSAFAMNPMQESFWVILLDRKNHAIGRVMTSLGTLTSTSVHPRDVFKPAILASASAIIVAHNHPSGIPEPSSADVSATRQLRDASKVIGIDLLDHIIVGYPESDPTGRGYYSCREAGLL